ncbi:MAG: N-acetylmuramoyl-L-alanine amidase family protein [Lutibacter sp.]
MKIKLKLKLKNVVFLLILLKMCAGFTQNPTAKKRIVIDVGHGGKDSGAIGINGVLEKDVVLNIAKEIVRLNRTILDDKLDIYLTRYRDTFVSLATRSKLPEALKADLFISIHCNASKSLSRGMEVYIHKLDSPNTKTSIAFGVSVLDEATQKLGFKERGVKFADFQVLRETVTFCPAILIETGFVTNADEADYFLAANNIKAMALAVLLGIINYLNIGL